jgi:hypothetical protein
MLAGDGCDPQAAVPLQELERRARGSTVGDVRSVILPSLRGTIMPTYSKKDFQRIAAAIGKNVADVIRYEKFFDAAAMWYRLKSSPAIGERIRPYKMRRRMTQIAAAAERLLQALGVTDTLGAPDPAAAPDGPALAVLEALASTGERSENAIVRATARLGRLVELFEAVDATRHLARAAHDGATDVERLGAITVLKGHRGALSR